MKRCPKCKTDYFDNILDFCLDDGERLLLFDKSGNHPDVLSPTQENTFIPEKNFNSSFLTPSETEADLLNKGTSEIPAKSEKLTQKITSQWVKILEITPIVLALAHNYWQWLYLSRKSYYEFFDYFFSSAFLIWLLLLITGSLFGIISLKYSKRKGFAVTALVVLAINVLLSIVPK